MRVRFYYVPTIHARGAEENKRKDGRGNTGGGHGAALVAGALENEVRERLSAAGGLERPVVCEVVERGGEDRTYVEPSRRVDDMDGEIL